MVEQMNAGAPQLQDIPDLAVWNIKDGLTEGIRRFVGPCQTAAIIGNTVTRNIRVFDDQDIILQQRQAIMERMQDWPNILPEPILDENHEFIWRPDNQRRNNTLFQYWFIETLEETVSPLLRRWLGTGASRIFLCFRAQDPNLSQSLGRELSDFAPHLVSEFLTIERNNFIPGEARIDCSRIVNNLGRISQTLEEGTRPTGKIAFIETTNPIVIDRNENSISIRLGSWDEGDVFFLDDLVRLTNHKHVSKMVRISSNNGCVLSDDVGLFGISPNWIPPSAIVAHFQNGRVQLEFNGQTICTVIGGEFVFPQTRTPLERIQPILSERIDQTVIEQLAEVVAQALNSHHGCTLVVLNANQIGQIAGQRLLNEIPGNSFNEIVSAMSGIDGALIFDQQGNLHMFGSILQGEPAVNEDRSRGSRFNSALRFSSIFSDATILVVSEDGPMTIIQNGEILLRDPLGTPIVEQPTRLFLPNAPLLNDWLQ